MATWIEPITDRTAADVAARNDKGVLQAADMNRVETDIEIVGDKLSISTLTPVTYTMSSKPKRSRFALILSSAQSIRNVYPFKAASALDFELPLNTWQKWNAIEDNLKYVHEQLEKADNVKLYCGEGYAGEGIGVI